MSSVWGDDSTVISTEFSSSTAVRNMGQNSTLPKTFCPATIDGRLSPAMKVTRLSTINDLYRGKIDEMLTENVHKDGHVGKAAHVGVIADSINTTAVDYFLTFVVPICLALPLPSVHS